VEKKRHSTPTSKPHSNCKVWWRELLATSGPGQLSVNGKMNSQVYQEILQENVRLSVRQLKLNRNWGLQQGNDPTHRSKPTTEWLQQKKIHLPDLKLI
jgi:hypothetical protein